MPEWSDQEFLRTVFDETRVIRTPLRGIIAGYHVLPYVLLGPPEYDRTSKTVEVRGRIKVSPRLVLGGETPTYGQMFGERELMDARIIARVFSFRYAGRVSLESEDLNIRRHEGDPAAQVERVLEELTRREVVRIHGLDEVGGEAGILRALTILGLAVARERDHDGRRRRQRPHAARDLVAVEARQADVHQRHLGRLRARELETLGAIGGSVHLVAVELE